MSETVATDTSMKRGRRWRDDSGAAAVEFALVLPILILLVFGIIEFGRAFNVMQTLTDAAREGARVAVVNSEKPASEVAALEELVRTTVRDAAARARLDTHEEVLKFEAMTGIGGATNTPATISLAYAYTPLFGTWFFSDGAFAIRTSFVMRNE